MILQLNGTFPPTFRTIWKQWLMFFLTRLMCYLCCFDRSSVTIVGKFHPEIRQTILNLNFAGRRFLKAILVFTRKRTDPCSTRGVTTKVRERNSGGTIFIKLLTWHARLWYNARHDERTHYPIAGGSSLLQTLCPLASGHICFVACYCCSHPTFFQQQPYNV